MRICLFDPNTSIGTGIATFMVPSACHNGELACHYSGKTLAELQAAGEVSDLAFVCSFAEALKYSKELTRKRYCKGPRRITKEEFWDLLEVLYPSRWEKYDNSEAFTMPEAIAGDLHAHGVRIGEEYFSIVESDDVPLEQIIKLCKEAAVE